MPDLGKSSWFASVLLQQAPECLGDVVRIHVARAVEAGYGARDSERALGGAHAQVPPRRDAAEERLGFESRVDPACPGDHQARLGTRGQRSWPRDRRRGPRPAV